MWPTTAEAIDAPARLRVGTGQRELASGQVLRTPAAHQWRAAAEPARARAFEALATELGTAWATWDAVGQHPRQILTTGMPAPGTVASAAEAERVARELLARHLPLLAPGSVASDFVLVSNERTGQLRSVGFAQHSDGRPVVGGQIGLVFSNDRLVMITSLAQSNARPAPSASRVSDGNARDRARTWIADDLSPATVYTRGGVDGPLVLPTGDETTGPRYREVVRTEVRTEQPLGSYWVYVDAETGEPVARESRMHYAGGQITYDTPDRSPIFNRVPQPVPFTDHLVNGLPQLGDATSSVTFDGAAANVQPGLSGLFAEIVDETGPLASTTLFLPDGGNATWSLSADERGDAQLTTYAHTLRVKDYVRQFAPDLPWLDQTVTAFVNIAEECNAMSDGDSIFFLQASDVCENTGRMPDVVYHEVGHSVHAQSIIPGVGSFEGALSEGISDYLAGTIVGDSGIGRGFFYTEDALRDFDPQGFEYVWPDDMGTVHDGGRIISGALWDLRKLLIDKYGPAEGIARTDGIYYEATRRAVDMPSMYGAALIVNDDDGDLGNGTPDVCEINAAFGAHGLFSGSNAGAERVIAEEIPEGLFVAVSLELPNFESCPLGATVRIEWGPRDGGPTQVADMFPVEGGYQNVLPPLPPGQVMRYRVLVSYDNGAERIVPPNQADPWFEFWFGEVEPIYCTSFAEGGADWDVPAPWDVGTPQGLAGDPVETAGDDPLVLGLDLRGDGFYRPNSSTTAQGPTITIPRAYESVRLHYRRWLTVEDGFYDQAEILADGDTAWSNYASPDDFNGATTHHRDGQWVFHDVDLTEWAQDGEVRLGFSIRSDGGLEMGGWNVDELCVVGYAPIDEASTCGDGRIASDEECDDGNNVDGDGCSAQCLIEDAGGTGGDDGSGSDDDD
ncbi:MAG: DUF4215 domain-containing protein, partial [Nannocystaceae bacterium]